MFNARELKTLKGHIIAEFEHNQRESRRISAPGDVRLAAKSRMEYLEDIIAKLEDLEMAL